MQINEKRLKRAKETLERLKAKKVGEINEAQAIFCASLKCYLIANEDDMADKALQMLLVNLEMEPDMILKTIQEIELTENFIAATLMCLRQSKFIAKAQSGISVN